MGSTITYGVAWVCCPASGVRRPASPLRRPQLPDGSGSAVRFDGRPHESRTRSVGSRAT